MAERKFKPGTLVHIIIAPESVGRIVENGDDYPGQVWYTPVDGDTRHDFHEDSFEEHPET